MTVAIDFSDPIIRANPYPIYAQLREESPVVGTGKAGSSAATTTLSDS